METGPVASKRQTMAFASVISLVSLVWFSKWESKTLLASKSTGNSQEVLCGGEMRARHPERN